MATMSAGPRVLYIFDHLTFFIWLGSMLMLVFSLFWLSPRLLHQQSLRTINESYCSGLIIQNYVHILGLPEQLEKLAPAGSHTHSHNTSPNLPPFRVLLRCHINNIFKHQHHDHNNSYESPQNQTICYVPAHYLLCLCHRWLSSRTVP